MNVYKILSTDVVLRSGLATVPCQPSTTSRQGPGPPEHTVPRQARGPESIGLPQLLLSGD